MGAWAGLGELFTLASGLALSHGKIPPEIPRTEMAKLMYADFW